MVTMVSDEVVLVLFSGPMLFNGVGVVLTEATVVLGVLINWVDVVLDKVIVV